jgi:hypothetical protein
MPNFLPLKNIIRGYLDIGGRTMVSDFRTLFFMQLLQILDPPPVVQTRTIESFSCPSAGKHDVTFDNNAQFFLLVTIEPLHRQNTGHSSSVLIGDRFASIAHVRRPYPTGCFVFSDVAVRTAGQYLLKFSLFERYISAGSDGRYF